MTDRLVIVSGFKAAPDGYSWRLTQYSAGQVVAAKDVPAGHTPAQWVEKGLARWSWWTRAGWALQRHDVLGLIAGCLAVGFAVGKLT